MRERPEFGGLRNQRGAVFVTALFAVPLMLGAVLSVVHFYRLLHERSLLQAAADEAALRAAAAQAHTLNAVALLNDGIVALELLSAGVFLAGNGAAAGLDALVVTAPEGIETHRVSLEGSRRLRETAVRLAALQDALGASLSVTPLLAAEAAMLERGGSGIVLLPYPLPGVHAALSLAPPFTERRLAFGNLARALTGAALRRAEAASGKTAERWSAAAGRCRAVPGLCRRVGRAAKKRFRALLEAALPAPETGEDGWPLPYVLEDGYAARFQVGVAAVRGARFGVAQARAASAAQPGGGDLFVPDFSPRLTPVRLPAETAAALDIAGMEGPWRFWH